MKSEEHYPVCYYLPNRGLLQGRQFLTKSTGVMAALMAAGDKLWGLADVYMKQFRYDQLNLPEDIKQRDVADIPGYHYRDDGMDWWVNLEQYCAEFIALHYTSDELVENDSELQNMVHEVCYHVLRVAHSAI